MKKGFSKSENKKFWRNKEDNDQISLGNIDLVNLRLNLPTDREDTPRKIFGGSGDTSFRSEFRHHNRSTAGSELHSPRPVNPSGRTANVIPKTSSNGVSSEDVLLLYSKEAEPYRPPSKGITTEPISANDFLYPTKKKYSQKTVDISVERGINAQNRVNQQFLREIDDSRSFPFKRTPSGNLKVNSSQVVFASKKLSVLVADPKTTRSKVSFSGNNLFNQNLQKKTSKMAQDHMVGFDKNSPMQAIMNQPGGMSSIGSLMANTPVRNQAKEAPEYDGKQTSQILDPELTLGRLGYTGQAQIGWDKVKLPEKENLYLELYARITNNTNADCKIYIENEEFNCHLIVLQCYSELFDNYVAVKKVQLPAENCSPTAFSFIYNWMINGEPSYTSLNRSNVLDIFNSAKYLKIKDLVEQCWAFIDNLEVFNEDTAFLLYMDAKRRNLPEVKELMLPRIQNFFLMLVSSLDWLELEVDDVKNLLKSNYIKINCEIEVFMAAVRWLRLDWQVRDKYKYEVLECVRFGNIAPWQLVDIKRNPENPEFTELAKDLKICKMIDDGLAYWYGQQNEDFTNWTDALGLTEPTARNWIGGDRIYLTYREFLIYLDQYRRTQLLQRKPRTEEKCDTKQEKEANFISERTTPRVPTMEEFMTKKKNVNQQKKVNQVVS